MDQKATFDAIADLIITLVSRMGMTVTVEQEDSLQYGRVFNMSGRDAHSLVGRQGSHLHALGMLIRMMSVKKYGSVPSFIIDIDDYYRKRQWYLKETLRKGIQQAQRTGKPVPLEPMPHYERRIVHTFAQQQFSGIVTTSSGREPYRYVVITPTA